MRITTWIDCGHGDIFREDVDVPNDVVEQGPEEVEKWAVTFVQERLATEIDAGWAPIPKEEHNAVSPLGANPYSEPQNGI